MYSVGEVDIFEGEKSGFVNSYSVAKDGTLQFINKVSSNGANPCHIALNNENIKIVVSNYTGGSFSLFSVLKDGSISNATQVVHHSTAKNNAHVHFGAFLNKHLFISDLGLNTVSDYILKGKNYVINQTYFIEKGAGPRHFVFAKNNHFMYVINELNSTISVLEKEIDSYNIIQNTSTLESTYTGKNACAEIALSKDEHFLYASNRGENTIAVFKINSKTGTVEKTQTIPVHGNWPRNFTIAPNGQFLLVANKKSRNINVYNIHKTSGMLTFLNSIDAPTPVCLLF